MRLSRSILAGTILAGVIIGIGITISMDWQSDAPATSEQRRAVLPVTAPGAGSRVELPDFTELVERLEPSVVNISTVTEEQQLRRRKGADPFEFFFGPPGPRRSLGSGFILDKDGYIITNHHVVEDAAKVVVRLRNEKEYEAKVIGTDAKTDIAVIKIDASEELVPVPLGDSDGLKVGEWVIAIGNPFGLDHTVTAGIVSAKGRHINRPDRSAYDDFIQTDAAINPGNSGGPLFNLDGEVVGVNSQIFTRSGGSIGLSFAIPVSIVRNVVAQLKDGGRVTRGWLGVTIQNIDKNLAESFGLDLSLIHI